MAIDDDCATVPGLAQPRQFTWHSQDRLNLSGLEWPRECAGSETAKIPVLCLPGLSRNVRDFYDVAAHLQTVGHRVVALDYRGRGKSDWDPDWRNYALPIEEQDISDAIAKLRLNRFALLGTSRGGLHALAMGLKFPKEQMAAVIFNDVGPHIEMRAIHRIAATLGRFMKNSSFQGVADTLKQTIGSQFPAFSDPDWLKLAHQLASEQDGEVVLDYDPALAHQFASLDDGTPVPDLWPLYENLTDRPVLIIHGEHSDLLTQESALKMASLHPNARLKTISGQGHAPVLWEEDTQRSISEFLSAL